MFYDKRTASPAFSICLHSKPGSSSQLPHCKLQQKAKFWLHAQILRSAPKQQLQLSIFFAAVTEFCLQLKSSGNYGNAHYSLPKGAACLALLRPWAEGQPSVLLPFEDPGLSFCKEASG
eukprot:1159069-Pelagomonas_calceolata.AAC.3